MSNYAISLFLKLGSNFTNSAFIIIMCDLLVHTFFRLAFGWYVKSNFYRDTGGQV